MSINSGFATRQQEKKYNQYLQAILSVFAKRLIKFYIGEQCDQPKFKHVIMNLYDKMIKMEENKFMEPHYSYIVRQVIINLQSIYEEFSNQKGEVASGPDGTLRFLQKEYFFDYRTNSKQNLFHLKPKPDQQYASKIHDKDLSVIDSQFKQSQKSLHMTANNFRKRIKTVTPEKFANIHYCTPQKVTHQLQSKNHLNKLSKDSPFKSEKNSNVKQFNLNKKLKKLEHQKVPLSPRQFLKQMVNTNKKEEEQMTNTNHLVLRTKQKHQKLVET